MLAQQYRSFKKVLDEQGIIFSFSGYLSEGVLYSLGDALRQKMAIEDTDVNTIKKVFSVFVEQAQNIIRYSAERVSGRARDIDVEMSSGIVTIGRENGGIFVVCANALKTVDVPKLRERLERLRGMDQSELKAYYKEQLREPPDMDSKGATIGLIEIARRASSPIEFDFEPMNDEETFFCLKVLI